MINLWNNQKLGADLLQTKRYSALWWEMRCGKTYATIAGTDSGDRLIVCPNSVKLVWASALADFEQEYYVWGSGKFPKRRPRNIIVNYETVWRTWLLGGNWDNIIFDESIRLQSLNTSLWWKGIKRNLESIRAAERVICLSGAPCPEGWHQLVLQAIVATGTYCGISDPFLALRTFFVYDAEIRKWKAISGHDKEARAQLNAMGHHMTQKEAGIDTKKLYRLIQVPVGTEEKRLWDSLPADSLAMNKGMYAQGFASGRPLKGPTKKSSKLDAVAEYVSEITGQYIIFTRFTESLSYLKKKLPEAEVIYGEDEGQDYRGDCMELFAAGKLQGIIANEKTVKCGLNFSSADTMIFAENDYSGDARIQAEERGTVKGKENIEIVDFVSVGEGMLGAIDQHILNAVRMKKDFNLKCFVERYN